MYVSKRLELPLRELDDADSPEKWAYCVARVLDVLSDSALASASECEMAWGASDAGKPWAALAKRLNTAALAMVEQSKRLGGGK